eukprot:gene3578-6279_t
MAVLLVTLPLCPFAALGDKAGVEGQESPGTAGLDAIEPCKLFDGGAEC